MTPDQIIAPYKNHNYIRKGAQQFLDRYNPQDTYPIHIEKIVEFQLGMDIIPIPGLHKAFDIDGFLSSDLGSISVDKDISDNRPGRYRFTLAHEIGHFVLHKDLYKHRNFSTIDGWKKFVEGFPEGEYRWYEWQAYEFAGLVLVPPHHLQDRCKYNLKRIAKSGIKEEDVVSDYLIELLARDFIVSREVIQKRLLKENFLKKRE